MKLQQSNRNSRETQRHADDAARETIRIALGPKFPLGRVVITHGAIGMFSDLFGINAAASAGNLLRRHSCGDWGKLDTHDTAANEVAIVNGGRILSAYALTLLHGDPLTDPLADGHTLATETSATEHQNAVEHIVWIITDAADDDGRRASTTILLPSEY